MYHSDFARPTTEVYYIDAHLFKTIKGYLWYISNRRLQTDIIVNFLFCWTAYYMIGTRTLSLLLSRTALTHSRLYIILLSRVRYTTMAECPSTKLSYYICLRPRSSDQPIIYIRSSIARDFYLDE